MLPAAVLLLSLAADPSSSTPPGEGMIEKYFRAKVKAIADDPLKGITSKAEWEERRPELRKQFLAMMGLDPLPEKAKLNAKVTGTVQGEGFVVEKVVFESRPGLFVTANVYSPVANPAREGGGHEKHPAILYVCGHGNVVEDKVSYGSKVHYQYHPAWFAAHGYVCVILDTLQLGEIPGEHHGTYKLNQWWWQSHGYTPGGVELWNAIRALDYLESRPDVDARKIGVTGRSGGGATSWWVLAADDRPVCFAPIAGIADLYAHVCEGQTDRLRGGVIAGHCDCMFMVNSHRWDFPLVAALAAPRPLLLGNSDQDDIFPVDGYRRLAKPVAKVYGWYDAADKFQLLETKGPHKDTPELRVGINRWMNRWLKGDTTTEVKDDLPPKLVPQQLKVLQKTPDGAVNADMPAAFLKPVRIDVPESAEVAKAWWPKKREELLKELTATSFAAWPEKPGEVKPELLSTTRAGRVRVRTFQFESEPGIVLQLQVAVFGDKSTRVKLVVAGDGGATFDPSEDEAVAVVFPRGVGPTRWAEPRSAAETHLRRRFPLIGETLEGGQVWDVRRAVRVLSVVAKGLPVELAGEGTAAGIALYASLYEPDVTVVSLVHPPTGFRDPASPAFLGAAKILDHPHAVAVAAATKSVSLTVPTPADAAAWDWPVRVQQRTGGRAIDIRPQSK
jgi:dienelactone hydrolase